MSGKYDFDRDLYIRKLKELREPGRPLCKHDWVGDDDCAYCRNEELENLLAEKDEEIRQLKQAIQNSLETGMDRYIREVFGDED